MVLGSYSWNCFRAMSWDILARFILKPVPLAWENRAAEPSAGVSPQDVFMGSFYSGPDSGSHWEELVQAVGGCLSCFPGVCVRICADSAPVKTPASESQMCGCTAPSRELQGAAGR